MRWKTVTITVILILVFFVCLTSVWFKSINQNIRFSNDIGKYNSEEYPVPKGLFPNKLPSNANVVSFSFYSYWHEEEDIYLELQFNTLEEMEAYLSEVKNIWSSYQSNDSVKVPHSSGEYIIETQNIYNKEYIDWIATCYWTVSNEEYYTGYKIDVESGVPIYMCNFGSISFSIDELTVIHSYIRGGFIDSVNKHTPVYFERFDVPLHMNHQRIFYLEI